MKRKKYKNYSKSEDAFLRLVSPEFPYREIAKILETNEKSVSERLRKLKLYKNHRIKIGNIYNRLKVIKKADNSGFWICQCNCKDKTIKILDGHSIISGNSKSCGCIRIENILSRCWKGCGKISKTYWSQIQKSAESRNLDFDITIEYIWDLFLKQYGKCALSGIRLTLGRKRQNASLDRINSKYGYTKNNVQWVHKDVNRMKWQFNEKYFLKFCKMITDYNK
jgi:hypothetical protein